MSDVISLVDRRAAGSADVTACRCGSTWFRLLGHDGEPPAVTMDGAGRITGYAGVLVCNACNESGKYK